ncbi:MAG: PaaI family thioesterase [Pseudomonadota bacterium]
MDLQALTARLREGVPLAGLLEIEAIALEPLTIRMPPAAISLRPGGTVSGPALMALADVAMWAALLVANGAEDLSRTTQLSIQFLRAVAPGAVIAEPRILKPGRTLIYGDVWIRGEGETRPAAHVTTQWAAVPAR